MKRYFRLSRHLLVGALLAAGALQAEAQGPPIFTDTPIMLGLEGRGVRSFVKVTRRARLIDGGETVDDPDDRAVTAIAVPVVVPYNFLSERVQVGIVAPFARVASETGNVTTSSAGLSDVSLFGKLLVYQRDRLNETFRVATKAGVKLGTGKQSTLPPLGSGSTDYSLSVVAGWVRGRMGIYGEGIVQLNGSNETVDFGNGARYNLALGYRLFPAVYRTYPSRQLSLFLELNGTLTAKSERDEAPLLNTGGSQLLLSPGVQYVGGRSWLVEGGVQLPIRERPNGRQLAASWSTLIGIRLLLF